MAPLDRPRVGVIVVNWNGLADTLACLESLGRSDYPDLFVVVVDNGSRDDEAVALRRAYPAGGPLPVEVLEAGENLGFTGGNNLGIQYALGVGADYVLCLNNDTVSDPGFLEPLVAALEEDPRRGLAAPHIFHFDPPGGTWYFGASVSLDPRLVPTGAPAWHLYPESGRSAPDEPFETEVATGCALLARAEVMRRLGGFDDRYFAYYEDVDLSLRARRLGYINVVVPASHVRHKVSRSTGGGVSPGLLFYSVRNASLLAQEHAPGGPEAGRAFYRVYTRAAVLGAFGWGAKDRHERWRRVQAVLSAVQCARRGEYGPRRETPSAGPLALGALALGLPLLHLLARALLSFEARALRRSRRVRPEDV